MMYIQVVEIFQHTNKLMSNNYYSYKKIYILYMNKGRYTDYTTYLNRKKGIISRTSNTKISTKRRLPSYNTYLNNKTAVNYNLDMDISACTRNVVTSSLCTNTGGNDGNSLITQGPAFRKLDCGVYPIPKVTCNRTNDYTSYLSKKKIEIDCNNSKMKVSNYKKYLSKKIQSTNNCWNEQSECNTLQPYNPSNCNNSSNNCSTDVGVIILNTTSFLNFDFGVQILPCSGMPLKLGMDSLTAAGGAIQLDNIGIDKPNDISSNTDIGWIYPNVGSFGSAKSESINWSDRSSFPTGCDNNNPDVYLKPIAKSVSSDFIISSGTKFSWMFGSWNDSYSGDLSGVNLDISGNIQIILVKIPCTSITNAIPGVPSYLDWEWAKFSLDLSNNRCGFKSLGDLNVSFVKSLTPNQVVIQNIGTAGFNISSLIFSPGDGLGMYILRNGLCINNNGINEFISPATFSIKVGTI